MCHYLARWQGLALVPALAHSLHCARRWPPPQSCLAWPHCSDLSVNDFKGPLPEEWGTGFPHLRLLNVSFNQLSGGFPVNYSQVGAFPELRNL